MNAITVVDEIYLSSVDFMSNKIDVVAVGRLGDKRRAVGMVEHGSSLIKWSAFSDGRSVEEFMNYFKDIAGMGISHDSIDRRLETFSPSLVLVDSVGDRAMFNQFCEEIRSAKIVLA